MRSVTAATDSGIFGWCVVLLSLSTTMGGTDGAAWPADSSDRVER